MKLNVLERIRLMEVLPPEANFVTFRIIGDLKKSLSFTEKELKEFKIEQKQTADGFRVVWDTTKEREIEIKMGEQALIIIKAALKKVDTEGKVNEGNITLFEKFLPEIGLEITK